MLAFYWGLGPQAPKIASNMGVCVQNAPVNGGLAPIPPKIVCNTYAWVLSLAFIIDLSG